MRLLTNEGWNGVSGIYVIN